MTLVETLRAARALVDTPEKWLQGAFRDGQKRCIAGALRDVSPVLITDSNRSYELFAMSDDPAYRTLLCVTGSPVTLSEWNDTSGRTHADVLAAFDRAIKAAEAVA